MNSKTASSARVFSAYQQCTWLSLLAVAIATTYWQALGGPFVFDDIYNIVINKKLHLTELTATNLLSAATSTDAGPLQRPIAMLSFALNHWLHGLDTWGYKLTNLIIHIVNSCLLFLVTKNVLLTLTKSSHHKRISIAALTAAAIWGLHPLNLTPVLYVVQRMNSLSALFLLCGLLSYVTYRKAEIDALSKNSVTCVFLVSLCTLLSSLSKENGILLPGFILLVEFIVFRDIALNWKTSPVAWMNATFLVSLFFILIALFIGTHQYTIESIANSYHSRPFTLSERLYTETRVVWGYLGSIWAPDITSLALFHDDIAISKSWNNPISTAFSLAGWLFVLFLLIFLYAKRKAPFVVLSIFWFLWGHTLESTIFPLEIAHEHRNYVPMMGITLLWAYLSLILAENFTRLLIPITCSVLLVLASSTYLRAANWKDVGTLALSDALRNPESSRSNYEAGRYYHWLYLNDKKEGEVSPEYKEARRYFENSYLLDESNSNGLYALLRLNDQAKLPHDRAWINELEKRLRNTVITTDHANKLTEWAYCTGIRLCNVAPNDMNKLADAVFANASFKFLPPKQKAQINTAFGIYTQSIGLTEASLHYYLVALNENPKVDENWSNYIEALLATNQQSLAEETLTKFEQKTGRQESIILERTKARVKSNAQLQDIGKKEPAKLQ